MVFMCYVSKSKFVLSQCNDLYFIAMAFIAFTLHEIKQCPVSGGTPGSLPDRRMEQRNIQALELCIKAVFHSSHEFLASNEN
jgi:hypothetical protein